MINELLKSETSWEIFKNSQTPIVLYGTGNGADKVLDEFERLGIKISGVMASDGFVRQRSFRGFKVMSLREIEETFEDFIIALCFASSLQEVTDSIRRLAKRRKVLMPAVPVFGDTIFNREYAEENADRLCLARGLLFDEESRNVFDNMIRFQYTGELTYLFRSESSREKALKEILNLTNREKILDLGAYRGDTIEEICSLFGGFESAVAFEPDKKSYEKLCEYAKSKDNIKALPYAVWENDREFEFMGGGGRQSTLYGKGKYTVKAVAVDNNLGDSQITYAKMDVEGAEKEALLGMKSLLTNQKPKLSVAAYHRTEDLCTLIPLIHSLNPDYKIHLRHHPYIPFWDTNLYCV